MKKRLVTLACGLGLAVSTALAGSYSELKHQEETFDLQCMALDRASAIKGICTWLKIELFSVSVKTSLIVEHRTPDLLVEARMGGQDSVLEPFNWVLDLNQAWSQFVLWGNGLFADDAVNDAMANNKTSSGSRVNHLNEKRQGDNLNFVDVTIIGNPYLPLYEVMMGTTMEALEIGSFCESAVTPFMPYYTSISDPEWRFGLYERLLSLYDTGTGTILGTRNINNYEFDQDFLNDPLGSMNNVINGGVGVYWGYIYPRMGYIKNQSMYRSAALIAQRAADIATGDPGLHIANPEFPPNKPSKRGQKTWSIPAVVEGDDKHKWQLNYPQGERDGCYRFPDKKIDAGGFKGETITETVTKRVKRIIPGSVIDEDGEPQFYWDTVTEEVTTEIPPNPLQTDLISPENNYIWTLWRTYKCCEKKGNKYIGKLEWD